MDSITQATLGALCGEMVLGRQLGYKGALWGLFFGTLPDLDVLAYGMLTATEQLEWHRGISHSVLIMFLGAFLFGAILKKIHHTRDISYWRYFLFVFLAWSTHVLIDCFNTYGTMIMEPFSHHRYAINNISIIDIFFLGPLLLGLFLACIIFRKKTQLRSHIGWITTIWLCFYFALSLFIKQRATREFQEIMAEKGIETEDLIASPTFSNIFLWRMHARDADNYYVAYWSIFDRDDREPIVQTFSTGHHLEKDFADSEDLKVLRWFCMGWHKTFQLESEPNSIYIAAIHMSEVRIALNPVGNDSKPLANLKELRPVFIWKLTKTEAGYELERPFKMSRDGYSVLLDAIKATYLRVKGESPEWMTGEWSWELTHPEKSPRIIEKEASEIEVEFDEK